MNSELEKVIHNLDSLVLFLAQDLSLRDLTPLAIQRWAFKDSDKNLSLKEVILKTGLYGLDRCIETALSERAPVKEGLTDFKNTTFEVSINPYFSSKDKLEGLVLTFNKPSKKKEVDLARIDRDNFKLILDSLPEGVYIVDENMNIQYINPVIRKEFGPVKERKCYQYFNDRTCKCPWCKFKDIEEKKLVRWDWQSPLNGKVYDVLDAPLFNFKGKLSKLKIMRDVTHIHRVQDEIKEKVRILELVHEPIIMRDWQGKIMFWNRGAESRYGWTREEAIGKKQHEFLKTKFPVSLKEIQETLLGKDIWEGELVQEKSDGTRIIVDSRMFLQKEKDKKTVIEIANDITKRKKTEDDLILATQHLEEQVRARTEELQETVQLLGRVFDTANLCVAYMDKSFNFIRVNKAYALMDNKTPDYFTGKNHFSLYPHEDNQRIFQRVVDKGESYYFYERPFVYPHRPQRGFTYWDWGVHPVKGSSGKVEGVLLSLIDVTQRKVAQQELGLTRKELSDAKRLSDLGTLSATVAHELRNPLGVIRTAAYNIKRKSKSPDLDKHIRNIEKKVSESNYIINNLLLYTRLKVPVFQTLDIEEIIKESVQSTKKRVEKEKVSFVRKGTMPEGFSLEGDPYQLGEVFQNLLFNAAQSIDKEKGRIVVELKENKGYLDISITDNGKGIKQEDIEKVFQPFFTTKSKGTGLGLSLSQEIVHLHKGKINIETEVFKGTKLIVSLPLVKR